MGLICTLYDLSEDDALSLVSGVRDNRIRMLDNCDLDKAWGAVHYFVLGSSDASPDSARPEDFLLSGVMLDDISEHNAVHTSAEVADFAKIVMSLSAEQMIARFDPARMNQLNVYGEPWDDSRREYILQFLEPFRAFILAAAEAKHAMLITIG